MSKSTTIDWNKAPEGATHHYLNSPWPWRKISGESWFYFDSGHWIAAGHSVINFLEDNLGRKLSARPVWAGEGLPPIDLVCQFIGTNECRSNVEELRQGTEVTIIAYYMQTNDVPLAAFTFIDDEGEKRIGGAMASCFGPLKTDEQIAADEKKARVDELAKVIKVSGWESPEILAAYLDSHDYRKQVAP